jgi:hypothetical protein
MTPDLSLRFDALAGLPLRRPDVVETGRVIPLEQFRRGTGSEVRIGIIRNGKARRNRERYGLEMPCAGHWAMPDSFDKLRDALTLFARNGVNALVINGGDGTVRDVLTIAASCFGDRMPRVAVVPSGKTNAMAIDLGTPRGWSEESAIEALRSGRVVERSPIEIRRAGAQDVELRGFLVGAGNFVPATELAQKTHRLGAFNGLAVGLSVASSAVQTIFGAADNFWRQGTQIRVALPDGRSSRGAKYLLLASTLERLPLGIRPFGAPRPGLKLLTIDAPPRRLVASLPALLGGYELPDAGYHRSDPDVIRLVVDGDIIVDGEPFAGGAMTLSRGAPIRFAVP